MSGYAKHQKLWISRYREARAQGTPDLQQLTAGLEIDAVAADWDADVRDWVNDGTDDVLVLLLMPKSRSAAVAYLDAGKWCAYRIPLKGL